MIYIGYDTGNTQLLYGLTQMEDFYFRSKISSFVALAPCVIPEFAGETMAQYLDGVGSYRSLGVFAVNGPNWESDLESICTTLSQDACTEAKNLADPGIPISTKNLEYLY